MFSLVQDLPRTAVGADAADETAWRASHTTATNLVGFCVGNHRGKHQAPDWAYELAQDGVLTVTTPTGLVASTSPPPF